MIDINKLAERILDELEAHAESMNAAANKTFATQKERRATLVSIVEGHLSMIMRSEPLPTMRTYRVWFKVFDSFGNEIARITDYPEINDIMQNGMVMPAYTAADVYEQSKLEALALTGKLPTYHAVWPIRVFAVKIRPEAPPPPKITGYCCLHPGDPCKTLEEAVKSDREVRGAFGPGHSFLYDAESLPN